MLFKFIRGISVALLIGAPVAALAQSGHRPPAGQHAQPNKPTPSRPPANHRPSTNDSYGVWNSGWGARPPAPPKHWARNGDWYRHVRACQQRYRSYNARTDSYRTYRGKHVRCRL